MSEQDIGPVRQFWGRALATVGILWMVLCGGCTLVFSVQMLGSGGGQGFLGWLLLCVVVGAICAVPGLVFLLLGRFVLRPRR
ncbi:MAG: hypothetical protein JWR84_1216 [Caulobacter sp.]|nr:hypothetical protein [Caulobacter sp.]